MDELVVEKLDGEDQSGRGAEQVLAPEAQRGLVIQADIGEGPLQGDLRLIEDAGHVAAFLSPAADLHEQAYVLAETRIGMHEPAEVHRVDSRQVSDAELGWIACLGAHAPLPAE